MNQNNLRTPIMAKCPEEFETTLTDWIDDLERSLADVLSDFEITDVSDLYKLEEARDNLKQLHQNLY